MLCLAALPSTVQSSIAFTSIAGGNVAGAVISADASNLLGIVLTPLIVTLLSQITGASLSFSGIGNVILLLLLPFVLGQFARRWLDRKSVVYGKSVSVRVDLGGRRIIKKNKNYHRYSSHTNTYQ